MGVEHRQSIYTEYNEHLLLYLNQYFRKSWLYNMVRLSENQLKYSFMYIYILLTLSIFIWVKGTGQRSSLSWLLVRRKRSSF